MGMRSEAGKELEEAEVARRVAGLTVALASELLERAQELGDDIEGRVRRLVGTRPEARPSFGNEVGGNASGVAQSP